MPLLPINTALLSTLSTIVIFNIRVGGNPSSFRALGALPGELIREDTQEREYNDPAFKRHMATMIDPVVLVFRRMVLSHSDHVCTARPPCRYPAIDIVPLRNSQLHITDNPTVDVQAFIYCGRLECEIRIRETFERDIKKELERVRQLFFQQTSSQLGSGEIEAGGEIETESDRMAPTSSRPTTAQTDSESLLADFFEWFDGLCEG